MKSLLALIVELVEQVYRSPHPTAQRRAAKLLFAVVVVVASLGVATMVGFSYLPLQADDLNLLLL